MGGEGTAEGVDLDGLGEKAICAKITHTLVVWEEGERPDRSRETQSNYLEGPSLADGLQRSSTESDRCECQSRGGAE